ncbi:hypothetical protein WA026_001131 [Henosepilachna vigintioctopunctata]|uniref:Uncharacterized protein n=1 Tax=Henosepilachna vigintioctopunctata TaxID=420089 RepID=A0AAW1V2M8_9CUCU
MSILLLASSSRYFLYGVLMLVETSLGVTTPKDVDGRLTAKAVGNLSEDKDVELFFANRGLGLVLQANFGD